MSVCVSYCKTSEEQFVVQYIVMLHALIALAGAEQDGFRNQIVGGGLYSMNAFVYKWRKIFLLQFFSVHIIFFLFLPDQTSLILCQV